MIFRKKLSKKFLFQLLLSLILFLTARGIIYLADQKTEISKITKNLNESILKSESSQIAEISDWKIRFFKSGDFNDALFLKTYHNSFHENGRIYLVYKNDSLTAWSDNTFLINNPGDFQNSSSTVVYGGNGYYLVSALKADQWTFLALQLIKQEYRFKNDYLPQDFDSRFRIPQGSVISLKPAAHNIVNSQGKFLFSISTETAETQSTFMTLFIFCLYILSLIFIISALFTAYLYIMRTLGHRGWLLLFFVTDVLIIRFIQFYFRFPSHLYKLEIFNPVYFAASEWLPSLGDFLFNAVIAIQIIFYLFRHFPDHYLFKLSKPLQKLFGILSIIAAILLFESMYILIQSLVLNSSIPLQFYNITSLTAYSALGLLVICLLLLAYLLIVEKLIHLALRVIKKSTLTYLGILAILALYFSWLLLFTNKSLLPAIVLSGILLILVFTYQKRMSLLKSGRRVIILILLALLGTYYINLFTQFQENEKRKIIATHLAESRDKLAEYYYKTTAGKIKSDFRLPVILDGVENDPVQEAKVLDYIQKKYFQGFWSKYHVQLTLCHTGKKLNINPGNIITECDQYFLEQMSQYLSVIDTTGLYFLNQSIDQTYYLGKIQLKQLGDNSRQILHLYIEINSKNANKGLGYPELLIDKSSSLNENLSAYSYAFYDHNELIRSVGKFSYSIESRFPIYKGDKDYLFSSAGYSHLVHRIDANKYLVISKEESGISDWLAPFSYLFLSLLILLAVIMLVAGKTFIVKDIALTFRLRLQIYIIAIILISSIIIGGVTLIYLNQLNFSKNKEVVSEKMNTVLVELENKYGNTRKLEESDKEEILVSLVDLSNTNFTDINLFGLNGQLLASSRSQIFDEGLTSTIINPIGMSNLVKEKQSFYIQREKIGNYNYLSAYAPLRNYDNQLLGYLNLPYFSRQEDLRQEMSRLLATYANLYILMIAMAVLLAVIISRYITRPLQLIREKIGRFKLGEANPKIEWKREDEIGDLVHEYNRMIDELAQSAEMLAKSEREIAWREMARQVAHEIKNPLTPMKLSMQHLIKAWDDKAPDWELRLKRFSQTLIMQIETLSAIASEFSDFAQMPRSNYRTIDLQPVISSAVQLFRGAENVSIHYPSEKDLYYIHADENQMLRVFNNLLKNAIQALPAERKGIIRIDLENEENYCRITFTDNGMGIPSEQQTRIFSPNFTTKSAGMGLGLAMVKNIIDNSRGQIWFESKENEGTTFYILLPRTTPVA